MPTVDKEDPAKVRMSAKPYDERGDTGDNVIGGFLSGMDYNADLTGAKGVETYKEMRNDGTVRSSMWAIKTPLLRANWFVKPFSDKPIHVKHKELIEQELFGGMETSFTEWLREALSYLEFGRYVFEIVYRKRKDGLIGWHKLAARLPETIWAWEMRNGKPGIQQSIPTKGVVDIPREKLLIFTNEKDGKNYEGRSLLRSAYFHWFVKTAGYKVEAMAIERQGLGIPVIKHPEDADASDKARANEILTNLRANNQARIVLKNSWTFEFANMGGGSRLDPSKAILHHDRQILKNIMAQFLDLGGNASGSYALSKDQSSFFLLAEQYVADYIVEVMNKQLVKRLIDINYGEQPEGEYPEIQAPEIGTADYNALTTSYARLAQIGGIIPNSEDDKWFRDVMGLPEAPDGFYVEQEFNTMIEQLMTQENELDGTMATEDAAMAAEDSMEMADEEPIEASEDLPVTLFGTVWGLTKGYVTGGAPKSEEAKQSISEGLKRYWATRKKGGGSGGGKKKGGKKGKDPKKEAEKAEAKAKRAKAKALRMKRRDEIKAVRETMRKDREKMQLRMLQAKAKGKAVDKDELLKMQIDSLNQRSKLMDKISKIDSKYTAEIDKVTATEGNALYDAALKMKETLDDAVTKLTANNRG